MKTTESFINGLQAELIAARQKFPSADASIVALMEEVGELAQALLERDSEAIWHEAIQVATMACRVATEVDNLMKTYRQQNSLPPIYHE